MRYIPCHPLRRDVSVLGFGCASLGSRVSAQRGRNALDMAFDLGVRWFDVAPSYGAGRAERILGEFIRTRRDHVVVCTKVGLLPRSATRMTQVAMPAARLAVRLLPGFRRFFAARRGGPISVPLDKRSIAQGVYASLRALKTDYIDVLALHDPTPAECTDPRVHEALESLLIRGDVRAISIAGDISAVAAGLASSSVFTIGQCSDAALHERLYVEGPDSHKINSKFLISHSVFDGTNPVAADVSRQAAKGVEWNHRASLSRAFARNPSGVVLTSMYSPEHIMENCACASVQKDRGFTSRMLDTGV